MLHVTKALATEVRPERLLHLITEQATDVLEAERSSLYLYDRARNVLESAITQGTASISLEAGEGVAGYVAQTREPLNLPDAYLDPRFNAAFDRQTGFRTRSVLCMPILDREQQVLGVIQVLNKRERPTFTAADESLLEAFCAQAAVALERAMLVKTHVEQQRMQEALRLAQEIQKEMLPAPFPVPPDQFELHAHLEPAQMVGGDLYDYFFPDEHRLGFAVGDVSGKGIPAALFMAGTHTLLRSFGEQGLPPERCMARVNQTQRGKASMFVTLFYGLLDLRTGLVEYCNAGHQRPVLVRADGNIELLPKSPNLPLCQVKALPFRTNHLVMHPGDVLFLYTDGVTEAENEAGNPFGEARLLEILHRYAHHSVEEIVRHLLAALHAFASPSGRRDDVTMLALRYLG